MGCSTDAEFTVMPEIALAKVSPDAAEHACLLRAGCRPARRRDEYGEGEAARRGVVFGAGMVGLGAVAGVPSQGAERIVCVDLSRGGSKLAKGQGATDTLVGGPDTVDQIVELTDGSRRRLHIRGDRQRRRHAPGRRVGAHGMGALHGRGRRGQGQGEVLEVVPRFLITGRRVAGSSFGGVKGRDQVPELVERALAGEIDVAPFVSHKIGLDDVNRGFELMEAQDGIRSVIEL